MTTFQGFGPIIDGFCKALDGSGAEIHEVPSRDASEPQKFSFWPTGDHPRATPARRQLTAFQIQSLLADVKKYNAGDRLVQCWDSWEYPEAGPFGG